MIQSQELKRRHLLLVVEDQEINRDLLGLILEDEYDVLYAENGAEGMKLIRENQDKLSMILLDLMMPVMDGFEVMEQVREDERLSRIPIIVMTADQEAELKALQAGALDFIAKPFDVHEIIKARVSRIIELSDGRQLIQSAERDPLTGLYTRGFFFEYAERIFRFHPDIHMDAMVLNIDQFHSVNELNGREFGDRVLCLLADEINRFLKETKGLASRTEADWFNIYCLHREQKDYHLILQRFQQRLMTLSDHASIRLRIGVCPWKQGMEPTVMFDRARVACNMIRGNFKTQFKVFDEEIRERELHQQMLLRDLQAAIDEEQFTVYYQPKYNIQANPPQLVSAEALIRWKHPELGMIPPGEFIPLFEEKGLIYIVDNFVWRKAAEQVARWRDELGIVLPVSVNLSRTDHFDSKLEANLEELLHKNALSAKDVKLEVTESAYTDNAKELVEVIERLRMTGFEIEMDDFGSGYSSLNMLSSLPIDVLKMDMKFIRNVDRDSREFHMVELILDIAAFMKVPVVAEGVETEEQMKMLRAAGCEIVQGFYFSKPLPAEEFKELIKKEINLNRGKKSMTIEELYGMIDGNYERALQIMRKDKMINKYLMKLAGSGVYEGLMQAAETMDPAPMFESAHAMKGVCSNLGLDKLADIVSEVTEEFRPGAARSFSDEEVRQKLDTVGELYTRTLDGIRQYEENNQ